MTEKRAQYRKKQKRDSLSKLLKRAKDDRKTNSDSVDVNPEFVNNSDQQDQKTSYRKAFSNEQKQDLRDEKIARLKRRLNWAIAVVIVLIIIVLIALFNF
ncbi:hypothetical protein [Lactobacillus hominis]|uniref:Uncharacterized protein n=1 Tax=Lactobacillus hominis DSM 23910 = CRBIP 24.179 TaxID=1423758 RepID=I7L8T1_9LACO|nr:hypothetical protein [Lactobacillus hominis]KRM86128.1 hypothetical protein FC41_GL000321 [Lactobacillus hominis DSM 23910 = CRBIP 24.179]MCT3348650.1 hypothetical protein [Lactobacillus hominis]CCI80914.1 Protein of unknown function [Lactobacillus hominis DSM 23910 = CRBIP 24.179]